MTNLDNVNKSDVRGWTALHQAAADEADGQDVTAIVERLLAKGTDPHQVDRNGDTAFNIAAPASPCAGRLMTNHWLAQALNGKGPKGLNDPSGSHGSTLAQYIAKWSADDEIEGQITLGVARGMIIDRPNASGWTPLTAAAAMGRDVAVAAFMRHYSPFALAIRTSQDYTANYRGQRVTYPAGITALGVARTRLEQDTALSGSLRESLLCCVEILSKP